MKIRNVRIPLSEIIAYLYIFLFIYAAFSKLLEFDKFQVQLGQSPLISSFAGTLSYAIPGIEIAISLLLALPRFRKTGFYLAFNLMVMFSAYIFIMLNFSPSLPCSCGGILEKMGWKTHLYFNLAYALLGIIGLILLERSDKKGTLNLKLLGKLMLMAIASSLLIGTIFISSKKMARQRNNFTRLYAQQPCEIRHELDLQYNSYYIAGTTSSKVYLGNRTAPLTITEIDSTLQKKKIHYIQVPQTDRKYRSLHVKVKAPYFYLYDGNEAFVYRGAIAEWKADIWIDKEAFFTALEPIDSNRIAIRAISSATRETALGSVTVRNQKSKVQLNDNILERQIDGLFDTDGMLLYNAQLGKIIYTYRYRNEYIVTDALFNDKKNGQTIDTTRNVSFKVRYVPSLEGTKITTPAVVVNKRTATFGRYLYVHAGLLGRFEPLGRWNATSVIDVYDYTDRSYRFSFYIDDKLKKKVKDFAVEKDLMYVLNGNYISTHRFRKGFY